MLLYALAIFLSAFLLFAVEPMIAKVIVPWFGGSAAVWTTCLLFFQVALLGGYLYAHAVATYLKPRAQRILHAALLAVSVLVLPWAPHEWWKPHGHGDPTAGILILLLAAIGLPFLLLSTTGPLLQAWFGADPLSGEGQRRSRRTYRLYAVSNLGSMLALISYPTAIEPMLGTRQQLFTWSGGYLAFVLLAAGIALRGVRAVKAMPAVEEVPALTEAGEAAPTATEPADSSDVAAAPGWGLQLLWVLLAACSSILLLAVTAHLSQNVAAVPFLWIAPLALYLLSFILCFAGDGLRWNLVTLPTPALALAVLAMLVLPRYRFLDIRLTIPIICGCLFLCCMACHGGLANLKPHPRYLTKFYLMISVGGALGGIFVGVLAPRLFSDYYELPLGLIMCALLTAAVVYRRADSPGWYALGLVLGGIATTYLLDALVTVDWHHYARDPLGLLGYLLRTLANHKFHIERDRYELWLGTPLCATALAIALPRSRVVRATCMALGGVVTALIFMARFPEASAQVARHWAMVAAVASVLLAAGFATETWVRAVFLSLAVVLVGATVAVLHPEQTGPVLLGGAAVVLIVVALSGRDVLERNVVPLLPLAPALVLLALGASAQRDDEDIYRARNFYGVLHVRNLGDQGDPDYRRVLVNGTINHGEQFLDAARHMNSITYYAPDSGVGLATRIAAGHPGGRVGVIGLGTGSMATYARPGDYFCFYDINPLVVRVANTYFSYLRDARSRPQIVLGDARLSLESEPSQQFDVLVVDAFSSDSIPVHLLTKEAFELYFRHLKPEGVLAVHVSNRYLELAPVVRSLADALGKDCIDVDSSKDDPKDIFPAEWVLVSGSQRFFRNEMIRTAGTPVEVNKHLRLWTDDYSNLLQILKTEKLQTGEE